MASADIYSQFLRPARSVADYTADLDNADMRRMQIANEGQTNALNAMTMQDRQRATAEAMADQNALQRVASAARTPEDLITGLRNSGRPALMKMADDREKGMLDRKKTEADIGKIGADTASTQSKTLDAKIDRFRAAVPYLESPQAIARWYQAQYQDPELGPVMQATHGPYEQVLQSMPKNPSQLQQWQQMTAMGMEKFIVEQRQRAEQAERERNNKEQNRLTARGQDITARGQNMTDARARELAQITKGEAQARREADKVEGGVQKYSTVIQKEGIPELETAVAAAEGALNRYKVGEVPGVGRAAGMVPSALLSDEGNDVRQAIATVRNIVLNARSGAAVTDQELRRMVEELGTGPLQSEDALRRGLAKVRARLESVKENAAAGVSDDVKAKYEERGGVKITRGGNKPATVAPAAPAASGFKIIKVE